MKFNTSVTQFQDELATLVNKCNLPISVIRLALESALMQVRNIEAKAIEDEQLTSDLEVKESEDASDSIG